MLMPRQACKMILKNFFLVFKREIKLLWHDPRTMGSLCFLPFVVVVLVGFLFSYHTVRNIRIAMVDPAPSAASRELAQHFDASDRFNIAYYLANEEDALSLMRQDKIEAAVIIPRDFAECLDRGESTTVLVGINSVNTIISNSASATAMEIIKTYSAQIAVKNLVAEGETISQAQGAVLPISTSTRPWFNPQFSYLNYLALGVLTVAAQQLLFQAAACAFAKEKEWGVGDYLACAGDSLIAALGKALPYCLLGVAVLFASYALSIKLFAIPLRGTLLDIFWLCLPFTLSMIGLGMFLGLLCRSQANALQWAMFFGIPCFVLSGYTWPNIVIPAAAVKAGALLPYTHFAANIRNITLIGYGYSEVAASVRFLWLFAAAAFLASLLTLARLRHKYHKETAVQQASGEEALS